MKLPALLLLLVPLLLIHAHVALCLGSLARSAGVGQAWWAWVPPLNLMLPFRLARRSLWWSLLLLVPAVNWIVWALVWAEICEGLGRRPWGGLAMSVPGVNLALLGRLAGWRWRALLPSLVLIAASLLLAARAHDGRQRERATVGGRAARALSKVRPAVEAAARAESAVPTLLEAARGLGGSELPDVTIVDALASFGPAALPTLVAALHDEDAGVRWHAAAAVMRLGRRAEGATPALFEAMKDGEWVVRNAAGRALEDVAQAEDVPALAEALEDPSVETRYHVARALGRQGPRAAAAVLDITEALRDEDAEVRMEAAWALGSVGAGAKGAIPRLIERLRDGDPQVRGVAAWAIGAIGDRGPEVVSALRAALEDDDRDARDSASRALEKIEGAGR